MGEKSAVEAVDFLIEWLKSTPGLEWLAEQVQDEIALGSTTSEKVSVNEESFLPEIVDDLTRSRRESRGKSKKEDFLVRSDYSSIQTFDIVLRAIETVVIGAPKMQDDLARVILEATDTSERDLTFDFDPGETGDVSHRYHYLDLVERRQLSKTLQEQLAILRDEVVNAD